uniref:Chromosome 5 open reading frame 22 n=1 Tax=Paramormyrops kingsleyae TaxID=1676925 RepID=A0A3B3T556_9TELE|nr:UPF0489 protein C5orf22 homolog isoform X1 [Paramormyrops kingsleyae]
MSVQAPKRVYPRLPVWIVEDHHDVVQHIYRAIGSKHVPADKIKLVHLDSHPDLLIPVSMPADTVFDKEALFSELNIENWIMPMVYAGHVSHVMWLHPYWAQQILEGEHSMFVGRDSSTTTIRVTSKDNYFLSDGLYVPLDQLEQAKQLHLRVIRVDPVQGGSSEVREPVGCGAKKSKSASSDTDGVEQRSEAQAGVSQTPDTGSCRSQDGSSASGSSSSSMNGEKVPCCSPTALNTQAGSTAYVLDRLLPVIKKTDSYILDIDLDFFSCKNPFKEMYTEEEYELLKELYSFQKPHEDADEEEITDCVERRVRQLETLEAAFADFIEDDGEEAVARWAASPGMKGIAGLVRSLRARTGTPDYEMVHQAGLTCDHSELPHHVSDLQEVHRLVGAVRLLLQGIPKPTLVTMSRSSLDEYCPIVQVDSIQQGVLEALEELYGPLDVHREYEEADAGAPGAAEAEQHPLAE